MMKKLLIGIIFLITIFWQNTNAQTNPGSLQFDGVDDFVNMGDPVNGNLDFGTNDPFTMMAWINTTFTPSTYADIISKRYVVSGTHYEGYMMAVNSSGKIYFVIEDINGLFTQMNGNITVNDGNWHLITATRNIFTDKVNVYVDGVLDISLTDNTSSTLESSDDFWVGQWPFYGRYFDGKIDEISIWNYAMDTAQINNYMNCPPTGNEPELLAYWNFDEGTGLTAFDISSGGNNGTLTNGPVWSTSAPQYSCRGIRGNVYQDFNQDCIKDGNESGIAGRILMIQPGNIIAQTSANGSWFIDSLPAGNYTISVDTSGNWNYSCSFSQNFTVIDPNAMTTAPDFGLYSTLPCPGPMISTNMPFIRRCFSNQKIYVQACNNITATDVLNNAYVEVTIDPLLIVTSASLPYTVTGNGDIYHFDLSDLALLPGECESFWIATTVSCNANLNQTLCYEAELFPVSNCVLDTIPSDPPLDFTPCSLPWDQSSISVDGWCDDGNIYFTITNTGDPGDGDMECYSPVRLYIDGDYISLDSVMLLGGDIDTLIFAGDGRTWRLEVDQHPLHPGNSHPNAVVELCGDSANWTPNLVNSMPLDDADPIVDIYCGLVTGSYDPNDKTGYPLGIGANHYILPNGKMEYVIRFQNTGNDTAFTVVVRDTLDIDLNILTVNSGVSSHNYTFQMQGPRVLEWTFENIMLPDSTTDEPGSNGFVTFTVDQVSDLPDGTEINNEVGIYFDFNAPVITNTTSHIIQRNISTPSYTTTTNISDTACFEYSLNDLTYTSTGQYYQVNGTALLNLDLLIANPQINANATEDTVCLNQSTVLTGTGGLTYSWSDGINNNEPFAPVSTQYYYVSGTDQFGCTNSDSILITVNDSLVEADFAITLQNYTVILQSTSTPSNHNTTWTVNGVVVSTDDLLNYTFTTNGTYEICLIAENSCNGDTECLNVNVDGLGIHVISEPNLIVYPNPAFNTLFIDYPLELANKNYSIYDATGKIVKQGVLNQNSIDIEMLSAGIFMIEIKNDNVVNKIKFIKQ